MVVRWCQSLQLSIRSLGQTQTQTQITGRELPATRRNDMELSAEPSVESVLVLCQVENVSVGLVPGGKCLSWTCARWKMSQLDMCQVENVLVLCQVEDVSIGLVPDGKCVLFQVENVLVLCQVGNKVIAND